MSATDKQILAADFYDFVGIGSIGMTDKDKIEWYRRVIENYQPTTNGGKP